MVVRDIQEEIWLISEKWAITKEYKDTCIAIMQDNLAPLRAKAGITQEELSNIIGCSRQTYYAYETNQRTMPWSTFLLLSFFYHELNTTTTMLDELKIYPIELISKINSEISIQL